MISGGSSHLFSAHIMRGGRFSSLSFKSPEFRFVREDTNKRFKCIVSIRCKFPKFP